LTPPRSAQSLIALSFTVEALAEDCAKAALVVAMRNAPSDCAAFLIDRDESRAGGALDITRAGKLFDVTPANPHGQDRPWAKRPQKRATTTQMPVGQPAPSDATPRPEDLETSEP
jgi:competence protein ComEC